VRKDKGSRALRRVLSNKGELPPCLIEHLNKRTENSEVKTQNGKSLGLGRMEAQSNMSDIRPITLLLLIHLAPLLPEVLKLLLQDMLCIFLSVESFLPAKAFGGNNVSQIDQYPTLPIPFEGRAGKTKASEPVTLGTFY